MKKNRLVKKKIIKIFCLVNLEMNNENNKNSIKVVKNNKKYISLN